MKVKTKVHGVTFIECPLGAAPIMRLVQSHAPSMRIEAKVGARVFLVPLVDFDFSHDSLVMQNAEILPVVGMTGSDVTAMRSRP